MPIAASDAQRSAAPARGAPSLLRAFSAWGTLFVFWLLLSGEFTAFFVLSGAGTSLAIVLLARRMRILDPEGHPIHLCGGAAFRYWPWLVKEIFKSAWQVTRIVLHPRLPISPTFVRFKPSQRSDLALVIHANSITLTPGTICLEAGPDEFLVHALTVEGAAGVVDSDMDRRVARLEGRS